MKPVLFLQNITLESPGTITSLLENRNIPYEVVDLYKNETIQQKPTGYGAIVVLGGPMNVDEEEKYPFLKIEKNFIKNCLDESVPVLGLCLGGQLLATAAGAAVRKNKEPEIGWMNVELNENGRSSVLMEGLPSTLPVFQWHGDTFDIPDGGVHLAYSSRCQNQAYQINDNAYGLQFHLEVTENDTKRWAEAYWDDIKESTKPIVQELIDHPNEIEAKCVAGYSEVLMSNFFHKISLYPDGQ